MSTTTTIRTNDALLTADGLEVVASLPPGSYTLRSTDSGVQVLRQQQQASTRAEAEEQNRTALERVRQAGGASA